MLTRFSTAHCPIALTLSKRELNNGMKIYWLDEPAAPVVSMALHYGVGARHERPGEHGVAHFLEHMMFRGSEHFGEGEFDLRTEWLGGSNNAFTGYDATVYHSAVGSEDWLDVIEMEVDRMRTPLLDEEAVAAEREIILEELLLSEDSPWEGIEQTVRRSVFGPHPYGRKILGEEGDLRAIDAEVLRRFHRRHYRPSNATLVVAGVADPQSRSSVETLFSAVADRPAEPEASVAEPGGVRPLGAAQVSCWLEKGRRWRLSLACLAPSVGDPDFAALEVAAAVLASGRTARLYRRLIDQGTRASWVDTGLEETVHRGLFEVVLESNSRADAEEALGAVRDELVLLGREPLSRQELDRAVHLSRTDWVFANLHSTDLTTTVADWFGTFGDESIEQHFEALNTVTPESVRRAVREYLDPERHAIVVASGEPDAS